MASIRLLTIERYIEGLSLGNLQNRVTEIGGRGEGGCTFRSLILKHTNLDLWIFGRSETNGT